MLALNAHAPTFFWEKLISKDPPGRKNLFQKINKPFKKIII